jgi:hypothetical protein
MGLQGIISKRKKIGGIGKKNPAVKAGFEVQKERGTAVAPRGCNCPILQQSACDGSHRWQRFLDARGKKIEGG